MSVSANATEDQLSTSSLQLSATASTQSLPALTADHPAPHIALLLPLKSKSALLARYADMVRQGFAAAAAAQKGSPIRIYPCADEAKDVVTSYRQAVLNGASAVVGPLTRDGVAALANYSDISILTLALNTADSSGKSHQLYFFGLPAENEARQVAKIAAASGLRNATIIATDTPLSKRLAAAFSDEWKFQHGSVTATVLFKDDFDVLTRLPVAPWPKGKMPKPVVTLSAKGEVVVPDRPLPPPIAPGNMVFLATDHDKARLIRPYLNPSLPVYGTSQLFTGNANKLANYDLNEVHFVDMPWLLQPDHPAVMIYQRAPAPMEADLERVYAMGIDAYRLLQILLSTRPNSAFPLDGVTGQIYLNFQQFEREPIPAFFKQGLGLTKETLAALNAAKVAEAAAKEAAKQAEAASAAAGASPLPSK